MWALHNIWKSESRFALKAFSTDLFRQLGHAGEQRMEAISFVCNTQGFKDDDVLRLAFIGDPWLP